MGNTTYISKMACCGTLAENEQALFTDFFGNTSVESGPGCVFYSCCTKMDTRPATVLEKGQFSIILNEEDASRRAVYGPCVEWLGPREHKIGEPVRQCPTLTREEYMVVSNEAEAPKRMSLDPVSTPRESGNHVDPRKQRST